MKTEVVENFPEYMVYYAVYGEPGYDITDEDIQLFEEWRERNGYGWCYGTDSDENEYVEKSFNSHPAFGLPCDTVPVVFEKIQSSRRPVKSSVDSYDETYDELVSMSGNGVNSSRKPIKSAMSEELEQALADLGDAESDFELVGLVQNILDTHGMSEKYHDFCEELDKVESWKGMGDVAEKYIRMAIKSSRRPVKSSIEDACDDISDKVEYYCGLNDSGTKLNAEQLKDLKEAVRTLYVCGAYPQIWMWGMKTLGEYGMNLDSSRKAIKSSTGTLQCVYVSDIPVSSWNKELALSAIKNNVTNYGYYDYNGRKGCCIVGDFEDIYNFIESNGYTVDEDYIYHWKEFDWDSAKKLDKRYTGQEHFDRQIKSANLPEDFNERVERGKRIIDDYFTSGREPRSEDDMWSVSTAMNYMGYGRRLKGKSDDGETFYYVNPDEVNTQLENIFKSYVKETYPDRTFDNYHYENGKWVKSARYIATDPQSGEVLGSADTYEEAVNEWGEDVTITDSEVAEGEEMDTGLFSNRQIKSEMTSRQYQNAIDKAAKMIVEGERDIDKICKKTGLDEDDVQAIIDEQEEMESAFSSKKVIKSSNLPEEVYYIVVNGSRQYYEDYDEADDNLETLRAIGKGKVDGVYTETNPDEIYELYEVGYIGNSRKSETTKQTITRLLSSVISGEMTEDEAAEEIAQANDVNIGYAKQIFSEYMNDKERYLTSGMLELGEALNVDFDPDGNLDTWFVDFAGEDDKPAPTLGGELVKAAKLIIRAFRDDGEKIGWGYAMETLNPAARFIIDNTDFGGNDELKSMIEGDVPDDNGYEKWVNNFEEDFADYLRDHSELFEKLNHASFMDAATESDEYTSVDEFFVEDDEGNQYWFQHDSSGWTCVDISYDTTPDYSEGDVITAEDYMFDNIDFNEEFGEFMEAPFEYSWEDGDGESVRISNVRLMNGLYEIDDYISNDELMELVNGTVYDRDGNQLKAKDIF